MFEDSCFKIGEQVFITITRFEGPHPSWIVWYFSFSNFWWVLQWFLCVQCICQLYSVIFAWRAGISAPSVWVSTQYVARKTSWLNCLGIVNESNKKTRIINNVFRLYNLLTSSSRISSLFSFQPLGQRFDYSPVLPPFDPLFDSPNLFPPFHSLYRPSKRDTSAIPLDPVIKRD